MMSLFLPKEVGIRAKALVRMDMEKEYKRSAVAFLDILGFKSMVEESKKDEKQFTRILNALRVMKLRKRGNNKEERQEGNVVSIFSDSIVISYQEESLKQALFDLIEDVMNIQNELLEYKILCRGGIAVGKLYHSKSKVFGPALIKAYDLEKDKAKFPRVVLKQSSLEKCNHSDCKKTNYSISDDRIMQYLCKDEKDSSLLYIDYLHQYIPKFTRDYKENVDKCIEEGLKGNDLCVLEKFKWLKEYWEGPDTFKDTIQNPDN